MVKTRHSHEADENSGEDFSSLETRSSARNIVQVLKTDGDSDEDSGVINFKNNSLAKRRDSNEDLELKPRRESRSKRVTYVEDYYLDDSDSEVEVTRKTKTRHGRRPVIKDDDDKPSPTKDRDGKSEDDDVDEPRMSTGRLTRNSRSPGDLLDSSQGLRRGRGRGRGRRKLHANNQQDLIMSSSEKHTRLRKTADYLVTHPSPRQMKRELLSETEDLGNRRSSRVRKPMYCAYKEDFDVQPPRKRGRIEAKQFEEDENEEESFKDIYSRVKRQRKQVKRDMYGMPIETDNDDNEEDNGDGENESDDNEDSNDNDDDGNDEGDDDNDEDDDDNDEDDDEDRNSQKNRRSYNLRENKPRTQLYIAPVAEKRRRIQSRFLADEISTPRSPARRRRMEKLDYLSPARRRGPGIRHKRRAFHGSSSTSSSESSSDEEKFQRRKAKSMMRARQNLLPMNFNPDDVTKSTLLRDRQKIGSSLADVDPMNIDRTVKFESVGGLGKHIRALKEMVVFPLMYPEIFERFKINPPRGVLFYGPPGTGKTLVARALANECSTDGKRVAFYMRKGADCLSKWVGESERQLRLLFDQAYQTRPSIIFFDEIDGLAPVRSSRQDQIHSSIVSTLLALMDGLDSRGEIVIIGATNRLDSIDPALRRPGRFDREFLFPLPSAQARKQILKIHTKEWNPKLCDKFVSEVAEKCVGYCGADLKALCTEVTLLALRRRYPQIYTSSEKLQIDVSSVNVNAKDFHNAMTLIVPASQRSVTSPARALGVTVAPLLQAMFKEILITLGDVFPSVLMQLNSLDSPGEPVSSEENCGSTVTLAELESDEDSRDVSIFEHKVDKRRKQSNIPELPESFLNFTRYADRQPSTHRPRLLLAGHTDQGQTTHLAPAIVHYLEQLPVHTLDLSSLYTVQSRTPEESCAHVFREAKRTAPSIVYLPHVNQWWSVVGETVRSTILTLAQDLDPVSPVLLLATSEEKYEELEFSLQDVFDEYSGEVIGVRNPDKEERRAYFRDLLLNQATHPPPQRKGAAKRLLEVLPKAPPPEPRKLTEQEVKMLEEHEEATLTELRLFLRDVLNKLARDRKFFIFAKPVDIEDVPDYYEIIKKPMDLSTMMSKIDLHHYQSVKEFLKDIDQICLNALEYNPDKDPQSRVIRHRACALKDTTSAIMKAELDPEFEKICRGIVESRKQRGEDGVKTAPSFYHTRPLNQGPMHPLAITRHSTSNHTTPRDTNTRSSRRLQGEHLEEVPSLEDIEKQARAQRSIQRIQMSPNKQESNQSTPQGQLKKNTPCSRDNSENPRSLNSSQGSGNKSSAGKSQASTSTKKPVKKDIWGSTGYRRRRRKRKRVDGDGDGNDNEFEELPNDNDEDEDVDDESEEDCDKTEDTEDAGNEMEVEAFDGTMTVSPGKSPARQEGSKSPIKVTDLLHVDVGEKASREKQTLPSPRDSQRSPKADSQKSPHCKSGDRESQRSLRVEGQKSPRCKSRDSEDMSDSMRRHSTESRSPRGADNTSTSQRVVSGPKSPRTVESSETNNATKQSVLSTQGKTVVQHLMNGFVDSGLGTSDSSGDSNDSLGQKLMDKNSQDQVNMDTAEKSNDTDPMQDTTQENNDADKGPSPVFHITRSRVQTRAQEQAAVAVNEFTEPLIVDHERLARLQDLTVTMTEDFTVPRLEKLYSLFAQCIYNHRLEFDKTQLIEELERRLKQYTTRMAEREKHEERREKLAIQSS
ncbi:ATPase family AAA domain-containing protein 2-like [Mya arenaria]|uniref:ATPase family AAA domain-containing protein 2-like n=1 Tax=Mya arenaria TaxID=6604 RepID=UPI0022E3ADF8|nr:ATPase family AAA domain-containing protein 2-like [Mya arenaria]